MVALAYHLPGGSGPPVLFIHGYLAGAAYWSPNVTELGRVCRPVVVELWGHGTSPSPEDPDDYRLPGLVDHLDRIRAEVGVERWAVVGHSLGSAIAMHYTLAHPDRVERLVVTNSQSGFGAARADTEKGAARLADKIEREGMAAFERHPLNPNRGRSLAPELKAALVADFERSTPAGLAGVLRWTLPGTSMVGHLDRLQVPTLLTWGVREKAFDDGAATARDGITGLQVVELDAGHPVNLHDPVGFNRAVGRFLTAETTGA